ncbi:hypothetical protein [Novosphingobium huizhouense]|nr:hypothetical protein [Novosphingobium huizhouense]
MTAIPTLDIDIYADAETLAPYAVYAQLRALGPVVHMPRRC